MMQSSNYTIGYLAIFFLNILLSCCLNNKRILLQELGGNALWLDRFLAQHIAVFYYFMTVFMYIFSPRMACKYAYLVLILWLSIYLFDRHWNILLKNTNKQGGRS